MTFHEFLLQDKDLYFKEKLCDEVIDREIFSKQAKVSALAKRVEIRNQRRELKELYEMGKLLHLS